jgi:hypothetical protein
MTTFRQFLAESYDLADIAKDVRTAIQMVKDPDLLEALNVFLKAILSEDRTKGQNDWGGRWGDRMRIVTTRIKNGAASMEANEAADVLWRIYNGYMKIIH